MLQQLKSASQAAVDVLVLEPDPKYRIAIGVLGVVLPPALATWTLGQGFQNSLSAYYYTAGRDWFVGTLWVIGVFLIFYQYRPQQPELVESPDPVKSGRADKYLGKFAGVAAVLVALLPTTRPECQLPACLSQPPIIGKAHGAAAFVTFLSLSLFPLLLFSQSSESARRYRVCGCLMLACLALIGIHALSPEPVRQALAPWRPVLLFETVLVWVFGYSWFKKGHEALRHVTSPASVSAALREPSMLG
jgi:hypothetical protein